MEFGQLQEIIAEYAAEGAKRGDYECRTLALTEGVFVAFFVRAGGYAAMRLTDSDNPAIGAFVQIAGAGACDLPSRPEVYQSIMDRHVSVDWGGPFARTWPDGSVVFGTQMVVPSSVLTSQAPEGFSFVFGMVDIFADTARSIAVELIPRFGGRVLAGDDPSDDNEFLVALIGPPPPTEASLSS